MNPDKQQTVNTYDQSATKLAQYFQGVSGTRHADIKRAFELIDKPDPYVLEIGCGSGEDVKDILNFTNNYTGMDISAGMIELARKNNPEIQFEVGDLESFKFPKDLDLVFAFASLLHSDKTHVRKCLSNIHKALNPNGVVFLSLKNKPYQREAKQDDFGTRIFYYYEPKDIKQMIQDKYRVAYEDTQQIGNTKWFTMALQKI